MRGCYKCGGDCYSWMHGSAIFGCKEDDPKLEKFKSATKKTDESPKPGDLFEFSPKYGDKRATVLNVSNRFVTLSTIDFDHSGRPCPEGAWLYLGQNKEIDENYQHSFFVGGEQLWCRLGMFAHLAKLS